MKKFIKFIYSSFFLLFISLLFSCELFDNSVKDFFEQYTNTAAVVKYELDGEYPKNSAGITCIPTDDAHTIKLYMRNPQHYDIEWSYNYKSSEAPYWPLTADDMVLFSQSADKTSMVLTFPKSLLLKAEDGGNDISGTLTLTEKESLRKFDSFDITLHANTAPPQAEGACFQLSSDETKYILCFYLPETSGTVHHNDTRKIYFNGELLYFRDGKVYSSVTKIGAGWSFSSGDEDSRFSYSKPSGMKALQAGGFEFDEAKCPSGYSPVYFAGNFPVTTDTTTVDIKIEDDEGLYSLTSISNKAQQLNPPRITNASDFANGLITVDEETGTAPIVISHDGLTTEGNSCGEVTIDYTVTNIVTSAVYKKGSASGSATIPLEKGKYKITATVRKPYYITSDAYDSSVADAVAGLKVKGLAVYYVRQPVCENPNGSKDKPFGSIEAAKNTYINDTDFGTDDICIIRVMSDIVPLEGVDKFEGSNKELICFEGKSDTDKRTYRLEGYGGKWTIDAKGTSATGNRRVVFVAGTVEALKIENLVIKGGYINASGNYVFASGIYSNSKLVLSNCSVTGNTIISDNINNNANIKGVGLYAYNDVEITNCIISENKCEMISTTKNYSGSGAGICANGNLTVKNTQICNNSFSDPNASVAGAGINYAGTGDNQALFENVTITGNKAITKYYFAYAGLYTRSNNVSIKGKNIITSNVVIKSNVETPSNLCILKTTGALVQTKIKVTGSLAGSTIGVTTGAEPVAASPSVQFTDGYGASNTAVPGTVFASDNDSFGVTKNAAGEAVLALNGGSASVDFGNSLKVGIKDDAGTDIVNVPSYDVYAGGTVPFIVLDGTTDITSNCSFTYSMKLLNKEVSSSYYSKLDASNPDKFKISRSLPAGVYTVKVTATKGTGANAKNVDAEVVLNVKESDDFTFVTEVNSGDTYVISTYDSLLKLTQWASGDDAYTASDFAGVTFVLGKDIALDTQFKSIGRYSPCPFKGIIDGNNHSMM